MDQETIKGEIKVVDHEVEYLGIMIKNLGDIHYLNKKPADWGKPQAEPEAEPEAKVTDETKPAEIKVDVTLITPQELDKAMDELTSTNTFVKKPPLGIMPKRFHDEKRLGALSAAIERYVDAKCQVPLEWIIEYNQLINEVK